MADRFIRHGATYNGDGTTSAEATSNGGVGAWNTLTIFEGATPPAGSTLPAGTTVYIRSKNAAGADITITSTAAMTLGAANAVATELSPITWVIDAGVVWAGVSGVVTYSFSTQVSVTQRPYNNFVCTNYNLVLINTMSGFANASFFNSINACTKDLKVDCSAHTANYGATHNIYHGKHESIWVRSYNRYAKLFGLGQGNTTFISPKIELLNPAELDQLWNVSGMYGGITTVFGGEIYGAGAAEGVVLCESSNNTGVFMAIGLKYPRVMPLSKSNLTEPRSQIISTGSDGALGSAGLNYYFEWDSRDDGYYPTLNATLELSDSDHWSYKVYPYRTLSNHAAEIAISKVYTQAAAAKTVTLEILWPTTMAAPTSGLVWIMVQYTDACTGSKVTQSTQAYPETTLATSTAAWSTVTYGAALFTKYKLSITAQSSIKQDTEVFVVFNSIPRSASTNDVIFVCPDPVLS